MPNHEDLYANIMALNKTKRIEKSHSCGEKWRRKKERRKEGEQGANGGNEGWMADKEGVQR